MLVKNWMTPKVITIDVDESMQQASRLLKDHHIRTLPVTKAGKLIGIVTDRDIKKASASEATSLEIHELMYLVSRITVGQIMTKHPITVSPLLTIDEVAEILMKHQISGVPVVDNDNQLIGIITQGDLFRVLTTLSGSCSEGLQFGFRLQDRPGSIKAVTDIFRSFGGRIRSIMSTQTDEADGLRKVYIKVFHIERQRLNEMKQQLAEVAEILYIIDYRENIREIILD